MVNMAIAYRGPDGMSQQLRDELVAKYGNRFQNKGFVTGYMESAKAGQTGGHFADKHGITHAIDIGVDIESDGSGLLPADAMALAEHLRLLGKAGKHPFSRQGYLIHDMSKTTTPKPLIAGAFNNWEWQHYAGSSPHSDHIHLTTAGDQQWGEMPRLDPSVYNSRAGWGVASLVEQVANKVVNQRVNGYTRPVPDFIGVSQDWKSNPTKNLPANHPLIKLFGNYQPEGHTGRDYAAAIGTDVYAVGPGKVLWADWATKLPGDNSWAGWTSRWFIAKGFAGIVVVIDHGPFLGIYAHLNETHLNIGDRVVQGQRIARTGNTGGSTGPHLHFEVVPTEFAWSNGMYGRVDPDRYLKMGNVSIVPGYTGGATIAPKDLLEEIMALDRNSKDYKAFMSDVRQAARFGVLDQQFLTADGTKKTSVATEVKWNAQNQRKLNDKLDILIKANSPIVIVAAVKQAIEEAQGTDLDLNSERAYQVIAENVIKELKK